MLTAVSLLGCLMLYAIARIIGIAFSGLQYHRHLHFTKFLLSSFWECLLLSGHLLWLNGIIECNLHVTLNSVVYLLMNHSFTRSAFTWWKHIDVLSLPDCSIIFHRGIPDFHHPTSSFFLQADVTNEHINSNNSAMLVNFRISTVNPKDSSDFCWIHNWCIEFAHRRSHITWIHWRRFYDLGKLTVLRFGKRYCQKNTRFFCVQYTKC